MKLLLGSKQVFSGRLQRRLLFAGVILALVGGHGQAEKAPILKSTTTPSADSAVSSFASEIHASTNSASERLRANSRGGSEFAAEGVSSGQSQHLKLTLQLFRRQVKRFGRLYYRLTVQNIGPKLYFVLAELLKDPGSFSEAQRTKDSFYLTLIGPDGKEMSVWLKKGVVLPDRDTQPSDPDEFEESDEQWDFLTRLEPGESLSSSPWPPGAEDPIVNRGLYADLRFFLLADIGTYKIRANYNDPGEGDAVLSTDWIEFEVVP